MSLGLGVCHPEHRCMKFYSPLEEKAELQQICSEETCRCAEGVSVFVCVCHVSITK